MPEIDPKTKEAVIFFSIFIPLAIYGIYFLFTTVISSPYSYSKDDIRNAFKKIGLKVAYKFTEDKNLIFVVTPMQDFEKIYFGTRISTGGKRITNYETKNVPLISFPDTKRITKMLGHPPTNNFLVSTGSFFDKLNSFLTYSKKMPIFYELEKSERSFANVDQPIEFHYTVETKNFQKIKLNVYAYTVSKSNEFEPKELNLSFKIKREPGINFQFIKDSAGDNPQYQSSVEIIDLPLNMLD